MGLLLNNTKLVMMYLLYEFNLKLISFIRRFTRTGNSEVPCILESHIMFFRCEDTEMNEFITDSNIYTRNMFSELNMAQVRS